MSIRPLSIEHDLFYLQLRMQLWRFLPLRHPHLMALREKIDFVATQRLTLKLKNIYVINDITIKTYQIFR